MASILLVDDDAMVRETVGMQLEAGGHSVATAAHGGEGLAALSAGAYDLVVTDILMPEVEGLEFIRAIRRQHPTMPVIAITGGMFRAGSKPGMDFLHYAEAMGSSSTLRKPFTARQILDAVTAALGTP